MPEKGEKSKKAKANATFVQRATRIKIDSFLFRLWAARKCFSYTYKIQKTPYLHDLKEAI